MWVIYLTKEKTNKANTISEKNSICPALYSLF